MFDALKKGDLKVNIVSQGFTEGGQARSLQRFHKGIKMNSLLVFLFFVGQLMPQSVQKNVYIMIGASNAENGVAANRFANLMGGEAIVCARGGSSLYDWQKGGALYDACLEKALAAGNVAGVLFINGEAEAKFDFPWTGPFLSIVDSLRQDLGKPDFPVAFARLNPVMPGRYVKHVMGEQDDTGICMVITDGLKMVRLGTWHYSKQSLVEIGRRFTACFQ